MSYDRKELLDRIDTKYKEIDQDPDVHLSGLSYAKPITYWDYIQTDALLGLQTQRTTLPDEMVFIMYHQINELLFKMILWEIKQIADCDAIPAEKFSKHLERISRYFDMLSESFNIMGDGMDVDQYMKFRDTLTPASGFQSAQYRLVEFACTDAINLIDMRFRKNFTNDSSTEELVENMYWQAAGKNYKTGKKSTLLRNFEERYKKEFITFINEYKSVNLWAKFKNLPAEVQANKELINSMRHCDYTINISWVMAHLNAAKKYLNSGKKSAEATGGSDWQKYMHPKYQRRIFYPSLWSQDELDNWGITNLEGHETV